MPGIVPERLAEGRLRRVQLAEFLQHAREGGMGRRRAGFQSDHLAVAGRGLVEAAEGVQGVPRGDPRRGEGRPEAEGLPTLRQCGLRLPQFQQQLGEVPAALDRAGVEPDGLSQLLHRGRLLPLDPQRHGQVLTSRGVVGGQAHRLAEMRQCGVELAAGDERRSEVAVDPGIVRLQPQRGPAAFDDAVEVSEAPAGLREIGVEGRVVGPPRDGPADHRDGPAGISALEGDQPQEVEGVRLIRIGLQGGLVGPGGPIQVAAMVVLQGLAQVDRHGGRSSIQDGKTSLPAGVILDESLDVPPRRLPHRRGGRF